MKNRKWDLTDAAIKRIVKRVKDLRLDDTNENGVEWYLDPVGLLLKAMEPENYVRPLEAAETLVHVWIRNGEQTWLCAGFFKAYASDRRNAREAGSRILQGFEDLKELGL